MSESSESPKSLGFDLRDRIAAVVADELYRQGKTGYAHRYFPMDDEGNGLPLLIGLDASINPRLVADAVIRELHPERTCELCGRTGTQKFSQTPTGWACRSVHACDRRGRR